MDSAMDRWDDKPWTVGHEADRARTKATKTKQKTEPMKSNPTSTRRKVATAALAFVISSLSLVRAATVTVSGMSNPWLAGATNGTTADAIDVAPNQSPMEISGVAVIPGSAFSFSATGGVRFNPGDLFPPDGWIDNPNSFQHRAGSEHRISNVIAPFSSLVGVFLGSDLPDNSPAPPALNFFTVASRDYVVLSPRLKQVFFIGNGRTSLGAKQWVVVPPGATRLFLGTMDTFSWDNNVGEFDVDILYIEAPLLGIGFVDRQSANVQLAWRSRSNLTYQIEYRSDLTANQWIPLGSPVLGTGTTNLAQDSLLGLASRYYRLRVLP